MKTLSIIRPLKYANSTVINDEPMETRQFYTRLHVSG